MPSLIQKSTGENCGTQTTRSNFVQHEKRSSAGTLTCFSCTNFSPRCRAEIIYHIIKKNSKATARVVQTWKKCDKDFHKFCLLREHKRKELGSQTGSWIQNADVAQLKGDVDDNSLEEQLENCKHFLVDSEVEKGRHSVWMLAMDTLNPEYLLEKLDVMFDSLKGAAKLNVPFGFVLKNVEDRVLGINLQRTIIKYWGDLNLWLPQKNWKKSRNY